VAHSRHDDHENGLIEGSPRRGEDDDAARPREGGAEHTREEDAELPLRRAGESGAIALRSVVLFAVGFVLGGVAIGSMGLAIAPVDPPAVRPIELRSPDQPDRAGDGADRRRDRAERRRGSAQRERGRRRLPVAPLPPEARPLRPQGQPVPPAAAPRPRTRAPRPAPAPKPAPAAPPAPQPAPPPPPPPADDDDDGDGDGDGAGNGDNDTGEVDDLDDN